VKELGFYTTPQPGVDYKQCQKNEGERGLGGKEKVELSGLAVQIRQVPWSCVQERLEVAVAKRKASQHRIDSQTW
jgi:hypothetical protein